MPHIPGYKVLNKIGEGSFSEVLKCQDLRTGEFLAAKRLKKRFENLESVFACAEIIAMQKITHHPNILYMSEFHYDSFVGKVTFLFELMDMSMYDFMKVRKRCIQESRAKHYLYQILCGLNHLHKNGLFHRDIKPENILLKIPLDQDYSSYKHESLKIADLGSIRGIYSQPPYTEYISTRWYRSPECLLTAGFYGAKMDVWATGCVFYEMLTLKPLFAGSNEVDQLARIHNVLGTPSNRLVSKFQVHKSCNCEYFSKQTGTGLSPLLTNITSDGQDIIKLMITYDPDLRSNVKRLLEHRYFNNYRKETGDKIFRRRSSSVDTMGNKSVGDHRGSSTVSVKKNTNTKYFTTVNRASQSDVINLKKFNTSGSLKTLNSPSKNETKNSAQAKNKYETYSDVVKGTPGHHKAPQFQVLHKENKRCPDSTYRKTTSNIPHIVNKPEAKGAHQQSKSFVLPRNLTHRLDPIPEIPNDDIVLPRPPKIFALDTSVKNMSKYIAKKKK